MTNRITQIEIRNRSLTPAESEVAITVHAEHVTPTTEVRGRLMGPTCPYSTTVEVAYPLRPFPGAAPLTMRVIIPEPSLWEPVSPFLYHGPVELWQDGQRCDRVQVRHGLCSSLLTPHGLRWNGKPLSLRGQSVRGLTDDNAMSLRRDGFNLLLAPLDEPQTWDIADRLGFLVVGELPRFDDETRHRAEQLAAHPSCLGWLVEPVAVAASPSLARLGVRETAGVVPPLAAFVVRADSQATGVLTITPP